jgi:hypothetical protein
MITTEAKRARDVRVAKVLVSSVMVLGLATGCGRSATGVSSEASSSERVEEEVATQRVCGTEFPLDGPADLARKSESVVVARYEGITPNAVTGTADEEDPGQSVYRFASLEFSLVSPILGSSGSAIEVLMVQDLVNPDGTVVSNVAPCATADFSAAERGDEFLLFLGPSNQSASYMSLYSASGVAQVTGGQVSAVGTGYPISEGEAKAHLLAPLVGSTVDEIGPQLE